MTRNPSLPRRHIIHVPVGTAYIEAVLIPRWIAEALEPIPGTRRMNIQAAHFWAMQSEMQAGTLPVSNENRMPGGRMEAGHFVKLADARAYLAGIEFELREDGAEDATPAMLDSHQFEAAQAVAELLPTAMREKEQGTRPLAPELEQPRRCELGAPQSSTVSLERGFETSVHEAAMRGAYPPPRQRHQEDEILRVLREEGYDPARLPAYKPNSPSIKAAVRSKLRYSKKVFDKAWERLRKSEEITDG